MSYTPIPPYTLDQVFGFQDANELRANIEALVAGLAGPSRQATVVLTPTQVKALFTTPIELVPAAGPGTIVLIDAIAFGMPFNATAYAGAHNLEFRYTDGAGDKVTADLAAATLNTGAGTAYASVAGVTPELTPVPNAPVVVTVPVANPTAGDSPVTFLVRYTVLTLP